MDETDQTVEDGELHHDLDAVGDTAVGQLDRLVVGEIADENRGVEKDHDTQHDHQAVKHALAFLALRIQQGLEVAFRLPHEDGRDYQLADA